LERPFPFQAVGFDVPAVFFIGTIMCYFMDVSDKELVGVEIVVDGDLLHLTVTSVPEISKLAATASCDGKMEGILFPQVPTVL